MDTAVDGHEFGAASRRDLIAVAVGTVVFFAVSVRLELSEAVLSWTRPWERYQLDELPGVLLFLAAALAWFAWRRMNEARGALRQRMATQLRLAEALAENRRLSLSHVRAQEEERKGLARELHDELGQHLNAIKVNAVSIRSRTEGKLADLHHAALAIIDPRTTSAIVAAIATALGDASRRRRAACSERIAASRPAPGPRTKTLTWRMPCSIALRAALSAARPAA